MERLSDDSVHEAILLDSRGCNPAIENIFL